MLMIYTLAAAPLLLLQNTMMPRAFAVLLTMASAQAVAAQYITVTAGTCASNVGACHVEKIELRPPFSHGSTRFDGIRFDDQIIYNRCYILSICTI